MGMSISNKNCFLSRYVYAGICINVGCPLVILVGARLVVRCQQCA